MQGRVASEAEILPPLRLASQMPVKKAQHRSLVRLRRKCVQIHMGCAVYSPEILWFIGRLKKMHCFNPRCVLVARTRRNQNRRSQAGQPINGTQVICADVRPRWQQPQQWLRQVASPRPELRRQPVADRLVDGRVHRFENHRIWGRPRCGQHQRSRTERNTNYTNTLIQSLRRRNPSAATTLAASRAPKVIRLPGLSPCAGRSINKVP